MNIYEARWRFVQIGVKLYATVKVYRMIVGGMRGKNGIMRQLGGRPVHAAAKRNRSRWHRVTRGQAPQVSLPLVALGAPALFEAPVLPVLPSVASVASVARVALVAPRGAAPIALALVASVASVAAVVAQVAPVALWPAWLALEAEAGLGPPPCATSKRGNDISQLKRSNFSIHFYTCLTYLYRLTACNSQFINFTEHRAVMQKVTVWHEMPWLMWQVMALRHFKKSWHMLRSFAHVWTRYISGQDFYDVNICQWCQRNELPAFFRSHSTASLSAWSKCAGGGACDGRGSDSDCYAFRHVSIRRLGRSGRQTHLNLARR